MELKLNTSLPIHFEKFDEMEDSRFTKVRIYLMHTGKNLNNSYFSKESVERAIPTLANIPIVGYISTDSANEQDFNGHEERIVITEDGIKTEYLGRIYGIIPESNNAHFETKVINGVEREYLVVEGLLYNKFPESIEIFERDGDKPQSMELEPNSVEGKFSQDGVFHFTSFKFEAACLLGDEIPPAMVGSLVEKFSVSNLATQFSDMLQEFNKYFSKSSNENTNEGGDYVDEKLELLNQYSSLGEEAIEEFKAKLEEYSLEDLEAVLKEKYESLESEESEESSEETSEEEVEQEESNDSDETEDTFESTEDQSEESEEESTEEEEVVEEESEEIDFQAKFEELEKEFNKLKGQFSKLEKENGDLQKFKSEKEQEEKMEVINQFSQLPQDIVKPYVENIEKYSKEQLETHLFAEVGKHNLTFSSKQSKQNDVVVSFSDVYSKPNSDQPAWADLVEQYKSKK